MLIFEIRNIIVDEEILGEVHLKSSILLFSSISSFSISLRMIVSSIYVNLIFSCILISLIFTVSTTILLTKGPLFEKWLTSNEITTHFDKLREDNLHCRI
jgi:hypothetical protein